MSSVQYSKLDQEDSVIVRELGHPTQSAQEVARELSNFGKAPGASFAGLLVSAVCCPITFLNCCFAVDSNEHALVLSYGNYADTITTPGIHFFPPMGRSVEKVSTKIRSLELPKTTVIDKNGNPLIISAVVTYQILNGRRALLDVENYQRFVLNQAEAALKQGLSCFPYESTDGSPCLKTEASHIGSQLCHVLQTKVSQAGALIHSFQLSEISYAPEIASAMLKRQQATAMVEARNTIVEGAVDIACHAVEKLQLRGIEMKDDERARLVTNLLTVICSDHETQTTLPLLPHA